MIESNKIAFTVSLLLLLLPFMKAEAQQTSGMEKNEVSISDAWVSRENYTLIIEYNISLGENITACDVDLMISMNGGKDFSPVSAKEELTGDIGRIISSGQKMIVYDINSIKNELTGKDLAFKVQVKNIKEKKEKKEKQDNDIKGKAFIMGTGSTFGMYGIKAGFVDRFGGYASFSDGFKGGMLDNWSIGAGVMMRATRWLYPYIGAGYGQLNFYGNTHVRYDLVPFEAGAMCMFGSFVLSAAVEPIIVLQERFGCAFKLGIGFCF